MSLTFALNSKESNAKTLAYLIGTDGSVTKIDTDTNTVISTVSLGKSSYVQDMNTAKGTGYFFKKK